MTTDERNQSPQDSMRPAARVPDQSGDGWLESMLASDAAGTPYVEDDGFTDRVMAKLPAKVSHSPHRWIVPAMGVLGFLVGIVMLSGGENLSLNLVRLASFESFSMQNVLIVAIPLGILYWLGFVAAWQER